MTPAARHEPWLRKFNPWWNPGYLMDSDRHVAAWEASLARYVPALFGDLRDGLASGVTVLYTVRGSRQVGKTTLAKLLLRDLLARGIPPRRLCYFSLGRGLTTQDLVQIIHKYLEIRPRQRSGDRSYIFIDEASMVVGWHDAILELANEESLYDCSIVATGSNAIDLRRGADSLIGRKGCVLGGNHRSLLPMRFLDYASLINPAIRAFLDENNLYKKESRSALWKSLVSGQENASLSALDTVSGELELAFRKYAVSGGIPHIVNHTMTDGRIDDEAYREYTESMLFEWSRMGYNEYRLKGYTNFVIKCTGGTVTWNGMSEKLDIANSATAETYAMALADMYVILVSYMYDERHNRADYPKLKKIHVRDPLFFHALNMWEYDHDYHTSSLNYLAEEANMGKLAECAVADHLASFATASSTGVMQRGSPERVCHWRDRSGREVDFVYRGPGSDPVPIEVKYVDRVDGRRLGGIASFVDSTVAERGIVATRAGYEIRRDYTLIPVPALLLLLS